ncbi:MAG: glycosyltransferase family 2 protein [Bacteroidales bacterium]|nr:glycosyltransferase family 2 protein [Bacteroidales bacterium]
MYNNKTVSVILPTYNEKDSIKKVIEDFYSIEEVDEVIVINNNAAEGTSEEVAQTKAIEIIEPRQGYGSAIMCGFREAHGDYIAVCEPDDTFCAKDIIKLLSYIEDVDIVYGSRTVEEFIWKGANMGFGIKWGNWGVAKIMEVLFNTNCLTDVGCTFRIVKKDVINEMLPSLKITSNFFGPEMMIQGFKMKLTSVQIPVNYKERVGVSSVTGDIKKAIVLGFQMLLLIFAKRFRLEKVFFRKYYKCNL